MEDKIKPEEWINSRNAGRVELRPKAEPKIDRLVSEAVGTTIYVNNSRVIKKVAEWRKRNNRDDVERRDDYLKDPQKVKELKEALNIMT